MKEQTRPLSKLYSIVFRRVNKTELKEMGICSAIGDAQVKGYISPKEYRNLMLHFEAQRPSKELHKEFHYPMKYGGRLNTYWWSCPSNLNNGKFNHVLRGSVLAPTTMRSKFLRHMIQITK